MLTVEDIREHHLIMESRPHAAAYDHLRESFTQSGHRLERVMGVIQGVKVYDPDSRYLFAWHVNPHHLLFYIRRPALDRRSRLHTLAVDHHPSDRVSQNRIGETKIRLCSAGDATALTAWLLKGLPLPSDGAVTLRRRA